MSATLNDHIDRLTQLANSIRHTTASEDNVFNPVSRPSVAGPFTRAILSTPLGDMIRDIDPSELGLFTLVQPPPLGSAPATVHDKEGEPVGSSLGEITRVGFVGATPLRKPPMNRDGTQRPREHEPEVYAHAALKYLERYQSVRPMPRAVEQAERVMEELAAVRQSIESLSEKLLQSNNSAGPSEPPPDARSMAREEERRIQELQAEINEMRKQKETLLKRKTGIRSAAALTPKRKASAPRNKSAFMLSPSTPDAAEHSFWNTPAAAARTLHFTEDSLLTDEHMDLSAPSLSSPLTDSESRPPLRGKLPPRASARQLSFEPTHEENWDECPADDSFDQSVLPADEGGAGDDAEDVDEDVVDDDMTIMLDTRPAGTSAPSTSAQQAGDVTFKVPSPPPSASARIFQAVPRKQRFKITEEMESIISKFWLTMGDTIMPGNPFDLNGSGIGVRPPRAKETLAHLTQLSLQTSSPTSPTPSISSDSASVQSMQSTAATTQQILIAHVLLSLLSSPPTYSLSLTKLKEMLAEKNGGVTAQAVTRPIYGCVAKKLLKIDRGSGEQVVRFDV